MFNERALSIDGSCHGVAGTRECDEERVSFCPDLRPLVRREGLAQELPMLLLDVGVAFVAERRDILRRPFNVGEQERDGAGW
jgi:hypothetical protein